MNTLVTCVHKKEATCAVCILCLTQARLQRNNKHTAGESGRSNRYVFSGKIKCARCGSSFVGRNKYRKDGTRIRRWSCGTAAKAGTALCDVGKLVRDDDAMQMLKTAIRALPMDFDAVIRNVTELALEAVLAGEAAARDDPDRLQQELDRLRQKREAVLDAYFSGEITKEDRKVLSDKYQRRQCEIRRRMEDALERKARGQDPEALRTEIQADVREILNGDSESEAFYKMILQSLTVFKDRHMELRLNHLPQVFHFT